MMKCVLAFVVLLHFCSSFTLNRDLNREILQGLDILRKLYSHNKVNLTSVSIMHHLYHNIIITISLWLHPHVFVVTLNVCCATSNI